MTVDPVHVDPDGVRGLARVQSDVASALISAVEAADSELAGFEGRYGPIAEPARDPLAAILTARDELLRSLSGTSGDLADRLSGAARAYTGADEAEAEVLSDIKHLDGAD